MFYCIILLGFVLFLLILLFFEIFFLGIILYCFVLFINLLNKNLLCIWFGLDDV